MVVYTLWFNDGKIGQRGEEGAGGNQGGALAEGLGDTQKPIHGGGTMVSGGTGGAERLTDQGDIEGLEAQSEAVGSRDWCRAGDLTDRGGAMERARTTGKPEGGMSPVKPKGWRVEAQPEAQKSVVEAERRPTEVCPDVRGSPAEC